MTSYNDDTDLIKKNFDGSGDINQLIFNIAPNQIFYRISGLIENFVMEHLTYGVNNSTFTTIDQNNAGYYLTHKGGDNNTKN